MSELEQLISTSKIKAVHLHGWRSYSSTTKAKLSDLKKINLIVGPNNTGKSNIFRYFLLLKKVVLSNDIDSLSITDDDYSKGVDTITLRVVLSNCKSEYILSVKHKKGKKDISFEFLEKSKVLCRDIKLLKNFLYRFEIFPSLRNPDYLGDKKPEISRTIENNGLDIMLNIQQMYDKRTDESERPFWKDFKKDVEKKLYEILGENIYFEYYCNQKEELILKTDYLDRIEMSKLGTGIAQIIIILTRIFIAKETNNDSDKQSAVFCIDEPDNNLHFNALVKLIKLIEESKDNDQFFFISHSHALIDQLTPEWSVHKVTKSENKTIIEKCEDIEKYYQLFDELGVRPSQLLLSNLVIWVEGPSDRIYIKRWIECECMSGRKILEGVHYTFSFYGGKSLKYIDVIPLESSDEENVDCINVNLLSKYAIIVCDSDRSKKSDPTINTNAVRLKNKIRKQLTTEQSKYIHLWITHGREIENYIPSKVLRDIFINDLRRYKVDGREITPNETIINTIKFDLFDEFNKIFPEIYLYNKDREPINEKDKRNIEDWFNRLKTELAKVVSNKWQSAYFEDSIELKQEIQQVINKIKEANGLEKSSF
ncbi:TPA: ATP-dependent endonuclease [Bacillus thuringiensis]